MNSKQLMNSIYMTNNTNAINLESSISKYEKDRLKRIKYRNMINDAMTFSIMITQKSQSIPVYSIK